VAVTYCAYLWNVECAWRCGGALPCLINICLLGRRCLHLVCYRVFLSTTILPFAFNLAALLLYRSIRRKYERALCQRRRNMAAVICTRRKARLCVRLLSSIYLQRCASISTCRISPATCAVIHVLPWRYISAEEGVGPFTARNHILLKRLPLLPGDTWRILLCLHGYLCFLSDIPSVCASRL